MIQNMSGFTCPHCQKSTHIFGADGVAKQCAKQGVDLLGSIPLDAGICEDADAGRPTVVSHPDNPQGQAFFHIADQISKRIELQ